MKKEKYLDLTQLEPVDDLDEEELMYHHALVSGETNSIDSPDSRIYYSKVFKESNRRSRAVNVRLKEQDYIGLKAKALELGMPYQSLLNSIIHQFLRGELKSTR
jgi:predicted DNA binding CopG/RHH family protein